MVNLQSGRVLAAVGLVLLSLGLIVSCNDAHAQKAEGDKEQPKTKKVEVGKNVYLEVEGDKRRVLINGIICRRTDQLEQFMCRKQTKEHEAIVSADIDAAKVHLALTLAKAEPGNPVKYNPKFTPASGTVIKVYVQWEEKGKTMKVPAQQWIKNVKTKKELEHDWVFAGSFHIPNRLDPKAPPFYAANDGDVICVANFEDALLDLPIQSSKDNDDLVFEAWTDRIPPLETPVVVILEPVLKK
jgi:hypothetical protein